jgi:ribosomal protein L35AE/L33A
MARQFRRTNGLHGPHTTGQISAWIALLATLVQFLLVVSPILPLEASIPVTVVFVALVSGSFYYGYLAQFIDPMDKHLRVHLQETEPENVAPAVACCGCCTVPQFPSHQHDTEQPMANEDMKQCWICDTQVSTHAMHCKFCNKCVGRFDHHCMWLNTCIGEANYLYFFRTMVFVFVMEVYHLIVQLGLLIDSFTDGATNQRATDWFQNGTDIPVHVLLIFFILFNLLSLFLITQLLHFHIGLRRKQLTTYQFIVEDHKGRRERAKREGQLDSNRIVAVTEAQENGQTCTAWKLQLGGLCRQAGCTQCDPLALSPPDKPESESSEVNAPENFSSALGERESESQSVVAETPSTEQPPRMENRTENEGVAFLKMNGVEDPEEASSSRALENESNFSSALGEMESESQSDVAEVPSTEQPPRMENRTETAGMAFLKMNGVEDPEEASSSGALPDETMTDGSIERTEANVSKDVDVAPTISVVEESDLGTNPATGPTTDVDPSEDEGIRQAQQKERAQRYFA